MQSTSQTETVQSPNPQPVYARCPEGVLWRWDVEQAVDQYGLESDRHVAVARNGKRRVLNWSGFQNYTAAHFIFYIENSFPAHQSAPPYHPCLPDCIEKMDGFKAVSQ